MEEKFNMYPQDLMSNFHFWMSVGYSVLAVFGLATTYFLYKTLKKYFKNK